MELEDFGTSGPSSSLSVSVVTRETGSAFLHALRSLR